MAAKEQMFSPFTLCPLSVFFFQTEDDSGKLTYSEVKFSNRSVSSPHSAPRGRDTDVIYSVPLVEARSDGSHIRDDPPLYSTVTLHQQ